MSYVVQESWEANSYMVGYYDGQLAGCEVLPGIDEHYSQCFDAREDVVRRNEEIWYSELPDRPERALKLGTVSTRYVTFYRVHSKRHFKWAAEFPLNWQDDESKRRTHERFSPLGTVGYYLGLTADAAMNEALYYGNGNIDADARFFLAIECYVNNILYLTDVTVLSHVWAILSLGEEDLGDMYFRIMSDRTNDAITDRIGLWARKKGLSGIVFPSARWGQQLDIGGMRARGLCPFPALNSVAIGCHLDRVNIHNVGIAGQLIYESALVEGCEPVPVYTEPNLVLFSGEQLQGVDRAVFYSCCSLNDRDKLVQQDQRHQLKSHEHWML